jgi:SAM-dependent methyltransferase
MSMNSAADPGRPAPLLRWQEGGQTQQARWRSEAGLAPPRRVAVVDDSLKADHAHRLASEGTALLWRGDFQNARQLLQALSRRVDAKAKPRSDGAVPVPFPHAFHLHRQALAQRARILGSVLLPLQPDYAVPLRRAPDWRAACTQAWGVADEQGAVVSLRELLGVVGAYEWRKKGVPMAALGGDAIHPHYGVFSPVRGEYVQLVAEAGWPAPGRVPAQAFDIGVGTGVLSAVLARRGVPHVEATDLDPRALACAAENLQRLGVAHQVSLSSADLFPPGQAELVVCNPPWVPAKPSSPIEQAVYDPDSRMLRGFLAGLRAHLAPGGQGWLILSDLAEHLKLRSRDELLGWIEAAGLVVRGRADVRPRHPKAQDRDDPLLAARAVEVTSLWRLGAAG